MSPDESLSVVGKALRKAREKRNLTVETVAAESGVIAFDDKLRLLLSPRLKSELPQRSVAENFGAYSGETLHFPDDAAPPERAFLSQHRATIFRKT